MASGWEEIRAEVLRRIRLREWAPGSLIPTEEDLARHFGCARATVNRALRDLAEAGVLERKRKAGTRVAALPVRRATLEIPVIRQEVEARGQTHGHRILCREEQGLPLDVASRLNVAAGQVYLFLETLHLADGRPFVLETRWLNAAILPPVPDFAAISANEWLVGSVPYAHGEIVFSAEPADRRAAEVLGVAPGTALFVTERITRSDQAPITFVRLSHVPGYRMQTVV